MSDEIPVEPVEGIEYVAEDGTPETEMVFAGTLAENPDLEAQALAAIRVEEDDETPPEPAFIVVPNKYGAGAASVTLANGEPLGVWFDREAPRATGAEIEATLLGMGLSPEIAAWFAKHRDRSLAAQEELRSNPVVAAFAEEEDRRRAQKQTLQEAFIKAQRKEKS